MCFDVEQQEKDVGLAGCKQMLHSSIFPTQEFVRRCDLTRSEEGVPGGTIIEMLQYKSYSKN